MGMSDLPDEIWSRIMEAGIQSSALGYRDLCCLSISCRRLRRLSGDEALWSALLALDFALEGRGSSSSSSSSHSSSLSSKSLYRTKFERHRARKRAAWRLAVLKEESQIAEHTRKLDDLRIVLDAEHEKLKMASKELRDLEKVRRASVAMNVWQPEVVCSSHRQLVQQCTVPVESRASALHMELRLCKQQIAIYSKAFVSLFSLSCLLKLDGKQLTCFHVLF
uniref:F-box protein SKIP24 n=1 Tax=Anthurium amnicola TaxID=1678845 RepID=A0A1D1YVD0_9ARAE